MDAEADAEATQPDAPESDAPPPEEAPKQEPAAPLINQTLAQQCALVAQQLSPAITTAQLLARVVGGGGAHVLTQLSDDELLDLLGTEASGAHQ